ncbi:MAG: hypothetical protein ACOH12_07720 [Parvibaculaceae bacterium]
MGLGRVEFELILQEHQYKPFKGEALAIGKQAIGISPELVRDILKSRNIPMRIDDFTYDSVNAHNYSGQPQISDTSLFESFTDCKLLSADINDYEGADFIFDICGEVPDELVGRFDFITDGGTLDNVFDPVRMLANMTKMLAPGGRLFVLVWGNSFPTAYLKVSPDWLIDYCAVNEFADCKTYALEHPPLVQPEGGYSVDEYKIILWHYDPYVEYGGQIGYECSALTTERPVLVYCMAEKGEATTHDRKAVQKHYRGENVEPYLTSMMRFRETPRPIFSTPFSKPLDGIKSISPFPTIRPVARWA